MRYNHTYNLPNPLTISAIKPILNLNYSKIMKTANVNNQLNIILFDVEKFTQILEIFTNNLQQAVSQFNSLCLADKMNFIQYCVEENEIEILKFI